MKKCCPDCMTEKDIEQFGKNKSRKDGIHPSCKACANGRLKNYRKNGLAHASAYDLDLMTRFLRSACTNKRLSNCRKNGAAESAYDLNLMTNFLRAA